MDKTLSIRHRSDRRQQFARANILGEVTVHAVLERVEDFSIDLDADTAAVSYGGTEIYNGTWVNGGTAPSQYQGLNIWASSGANVENFYIDNLKLDIVPEPSGLALLGLSFVGLVLRRRR